MHFTRLALALLSSVALFIQSASAITADELAQFLGISSWDTTVTLPPDSFTADIFEIIDGKLGEPSLRSGGEAAKDPAKGLSIIVGPHEGHYRVTMRCGSGVHGMPTKVPLLGQTRSNRLPEKIGEGDFIFFGQPAEANERWLGANEIGSYARGFLLRVKKKDAAAIEHSKALRCLSNAKMIATACKLFAHDNDGKFPTKHTELLPDYLADPKVFHCPFAPTSDEIGYDLSGGKDSDEPSHVLVRGRFTTTDGRRSVVYVNRWGALEWR